MQLYPLLTVLFVCTLSALSYVQSAPNPMLPPPYPGTRNEVRFELIEAHSNGAYFYPWYQKITNGVRDTESRYHLRVDRFGNLYQHQYSGVNLKHISAKIDGKTIYFDANYNSLAEKNTKPLGTVGLSDLDVKGNKQHIVAYQGNSIEADAPQPDRSALVIPPPPSVTVIHLGAPEMPFVQSQPVPRVLNPQQISVVLAPKRRSFFSRLFGRRQ